MKHLLTVGLLLLCAVASAQEPLLTNRATELREAPDADAKVLQALPEKSPVQLIERKGAWSQVKAGTVTGWVRMMHLRGGVVVVEAQPQSAGGSALSSFSRLLGGNRAQPDTRSRNATLGVRGLSPEDLKTASPNVQDLARLAVLQTDKPAAEKFAREVPLAKMEIAELSANDRGGRK